MVPASRTLALYLVLGLMLAACTDDPTVEAPSPDEPDVVPVDVAPSALDDMSHPDLPPPLVEPSEIIAGGPPADGIPPIDAPEFVTIDEADAWLEPQEPVIGVRLGDDARAYPVQILIWHEIVNDTVDDTPVTVTYCPLCNSAISFERTVNGEVDTFGTSGLLYHSALVMYDRRTESLWSHFTGRAIAGARTGEQLEIVRSPLVSWEEFSRQHPDGLVLDRERTGHERQYGRNPYTGYDDPDPDARRPFLFRGDVDERSHARQRVVGIEFGGESRAWTLDAVRDGEASATNIELAGEPLVILWRAGQASALDHIQIRQGRDVGSVAVFRSEVDGERLTFVADGEGFLDEETGSRWDLGGEALEGELTGQRLEQIHHFDTFWFAWAAFQPDTDLIEE